MRSLGCLFAPSLCLDCVVLSVHLHQHANGDEYCHPLFSDSLSVSCFFSRALLSFSPDASLSALFLYSSVVSLLFSCCFLTVFLASFHLLFPSILRAFVFSLYQHDGPSLAGCASCSVLAFFTVCALHFAVPHYGDMDANFSCCLYCCICTSAFSVSCVFGMCFARSCFL